MQKIFTTLLVMATTISVSSQSIQSLIPSISTSPQAEAFKMYGDYAVNPSTGIPDISIPLYEINHYGFTIPVTLKYAAKPLKPGYNYDVFGLGWALPVNGCISRSIEYVPDEWKNFKLETPNSSAYFNNCGTSCLTDYNYAHDKFNVVLPDGSTFDFVIENISDRIVYKISEGRQVQISCSSSTSQIQSFTIIDEKGVKYTFDGGDTPQSGGYYPYQNSFVSWLLSRIDLPHTAEPILFYYNQEMSPSPTTCDEPTLKIANYKKATTVGGQTDLHDEYVVQRTTEHLPSAYKMRLLTSITYGSNGKTQVRLFYKYSGDWAKSYQADKLQILEDGSLIRQIEFITSMYGGTSACYNFQLSSLNKVLIKGSDPNVEPMKYEFQNYPLGIFSGVDHWGNLNSDGNDLPNYNIYVGWDLFATGHAAAAGLTPVSKEPYDPSPFYKFKISQPWHYNNDCRSPNAPSSHAVLSRIKYPTGGYTDFEFENHKFLTSMDGNGNFEFDSQDRVVQYASAFRIKTITTYSSNGAPAGKKNYRYGKTVGETYGSTGADALFHTGWGEAVADPNILTYLSYADYYSYHSPELVSLKNMVLGLNKDGQHQPFSNPFATYEMQNSEWAWTITLSAANFRKILNGRQPVVYSEVTVYEGDIDENNKVYPSGKTVYTYDLSGDNGEQFFELNKVYGNTISYEPKPYYYNRLKEKTDYKFNAQEQRFKPVKKETNTWYNLTNAFIDYQLGNIYLPEFYSSYRDPWDFASWIYFPVAPAFFLKHSYQGITLPATKTTTLWDEQDRLITTSESFEYNDRAQLNLKILSNSTGELITNGFKYPQISDPGTEPIIDEMVSKNIISPVTEASTNIYLKGRIAASKIEFSKFGENQIIMPAKSYELEINQSTSNYVLRSEVKNYSPNGNPLEIVSKDGILTSYIWGYKDRYMIAEVKNAASVDVAYSSFEDETKGNWNYTGMVTTPTSGTSVPTGRKYYNLSDNGALNKIVISGKTYIISYWSNSPNPYSIIGGSGTVAAGRTISGWTYFEHRVTSVNSTLSISGIGGIDEVRLYPAEAQMTTFTYDPLIGITTQCDINNRVTYYQYDGFGRLQIVRDDEGNILKTVEYHYKQ